MKKFITLSLISVFLLFNIKAANADSGNMTREQAIELAIKIAQEKMSGSQKHQSRPANAVQGSLKRDSGNKISKALGSASVMAEKAAKKINSSNDIIKVSGSYRMGFGVEGTGSGTDFIWKKADADLNERNWRYIFGEKKFNTYDPEIYDQLRFIVRTKHEEAVFGGIEIVVDPWSFAGKSAKETYTTNYGSTVDVQLKYMSNNSRLISETVRDSTGDGFSIPEIKVVNGVVKGTRLDGTFNAGLPFVHRFSLKDTKIDTEFRPVRKLWAGFKTDYVKFKAFPYFDESAALSSDDPLGLSNHHIYWENSPWLNQWEQGQYFAGGMRAFKRGSWSNTFPYRLKDSEGNRLVLLRGLTAEANYEKLSMISTVGTPIMPWDDYGLVNNIAGATRIKYKLFDNLMIGGTSTGRIGRANGNTDALNAVNAIDAEIKILPKLVFKGELGQSMTRTDLASKDANNTWDKSYYGNVIKTDIFYELDSPKGPVNFQFIYGHMGKNFDPSLANYYNTRKDPNWSRHLRFKALDPTQEAFHLGDSIDVDRDAFSLISRAKLFDERFETLFNYRNAHDASSGKYLESVFRNESGYRINSKLMAKAMFVYQILPRTLYHTDPQVSTNEYYVSQELRALPWLNTQIMDHENPSNVSAGFGLRYEPNTKIATEGVFERSNYYYFPQGLLNGVGYGGVTTNDGVRLDGQAPFLYNQEFFPLPYYRFTNIYKVKLELTPVKDLKFTFDFVRNGFRYAAGLDDNINHGGFRTDYNITKRLSTRFEYIFSQIIDVYRQLQGYGSKFTGHHNFYAMFNYQINDLSGLKLEYGNGTTLPYSLNYQYATDWALLTYDTQHIIRLTYEGKF